MIVAAKWTMKYEILTTKSNIQGQVPCPLMFFHYYMYCYCIFSIWDSKNSWNWWVIFVTATIWQLFDVKYLFIYKTIITVKSYTEIKLSFIQARNDRERKLFEYLGSCIEKLVKSLWVNLFLADFNNLALLCAAVRSDGLLLTWIDALSADDARKASMKMAHRATPIKQQCTVQWVKAILFI